MFLRILFTALFLFAVSPSARASFSFFSKSEGACGNGVFSLDILEEIDRSSAMERALEKVMDDLSFDLDRHDYILLNLYSGDQKNYSDGVFLKIQKSKNIQGKQIGIQFRFYENSAGAYAKNTQSFQSFKRIPIGKDTSMEGALITDLFLEGLVDFSVGLGVQSKNFGGFRFVFPKNYSPPFTHFLKIENQSLLESKMSELAEIFGDGFRQKWGPGFKGFQYRFSETPFDVVIAFELVQ